MNGCEYFEQLCAVSIDGTLTDEERKSLDAHLAECPSCAALYEELHQMDELLHTPVTIPPSLHNDIMARVREEAKPKIVQLEKPIRRSPVIAFVAAAAVVALVAMGGGIGQFFNLLEQTGLAMGSGSAGGNAENWNMSGSVEDSAPAPESQEAEEPMADQTPSLFSSRKAVSPESRSRDVPEGSDSAADSDGGWTSDNSANGADDENEITSDWATDGYINGSGGGWTTYSGSTDTDTDSAAPAPAPTPIAPQSDVSPEGDNAQESGGADYSDRVTNGAGNAGGSSGSSGSGSSSSANKNNARASEETVQAPAAYDNTAISLPDSIQGSVVAHCYLAVGDGELPSIDGDLLVTEDNISYFSVANNMSLLEKTLSDIEEAGYSVTPYEGVGLVTDAKAVSWLLIVKNQ